MPELSDDDILEIINFLPGLIGTEEDAVRLIALTRQALTFLPDQPYCSIDAVVPFVTALATVLTTMPKWDGDLPLDCRLSEGWVRQNRIAEVAGEVMAMTERGGVGSHGARAAVDMALMRDWLQEERPAFEADRMDPKVRATIAGRRKCPIALPTSKMQSPVCVATASTTNGSSGASSKTPVTTMPLRSPPPAPTHSPDFTSVVWFGISYTFRPGRQAEAVRHLWAAWQNGTPTLSQNKIGELVQSEADRFKLTDVFRGNPAFGTMIVRAGTGQGVFRLSEPPPNDAETPPAG